MKKLLLWITILVLSISMLAVFSLAGCKTTTAAAETTTAAAAETTVAAETTAAEAEISANLRILYPGTSEAEKKLSIDIQNAVKAKYPKINIEFMPLVWADIEKKLVVMVQGKDFPDLMMVQDVTNPVAMDALEPLDSYFNDNIKPDMFMKAPLEYMKVDGKQYAIPGLAVIYSHIVNTEMLQAAGMKPEDLKSWDDVKKAVKAMAKDGKYGYAMANGGEGRFTFRDFMMISLSNGITPDDVSDKSKKQYIEVLNLLNDMSGYMPKSQVTWLYPELFKAWEAEQMGMMHTGSYYTANAITHGTNNMKWTVPVVFPKGPSADKPQAMVGAAGFAIIKGSEQKEAAWKVIETIMSPEILSEWAGALGVSAGDYITNDMLMKSAKEAYPDVWQEHLKIIEGFSNIANEYGVPLPKILGQPQMEKILQGSLIKMLDKKITPDQAYEEIRKGIEEVKTSFQK
ncbi:MAG: ABC transporter substrate-binding protein [Candidatus Humimicrobiaceae bacterium]